MGNTSVGALLSNIRQNMKETDNDKHSSLLWLIPNTPAYNSISSCYFSFLSHGLKLQKIDQIDPKAK